MKTNLKSLFFTVLLGLSFAPTTQASAMRICLPGSDKEIADCANMNFQRIKRKVDSRLSFCSSQGAPLVMCSNQNFKRLEKELDLNLQTCFMGSSTFVYCLNANFKKIKNAL